MNKIIMTFLTFCGIGLGGVLLYILTGGFGIPFVATSGILAYFIAEKVLSLIMDEINNVLGEDNNSSKEGNKIMIDKIIVTFLAFCGIGLMGILLYILTGGFGIPFVLTSGILAYLVADKIV